MAEVDERRAEQGSGFERRLAQGLPLVPLAIAFLPHQSLLLRAVWVAFAAAAASGFGSLTERRSRPRRIKNGAFAVSVLAFGVLAGLSVGQGPAGAPSNDTPTLAAPARAAAPAAAPSTTVASQVRGAATTAEAELAQCEELLRSVRRDIAPLVTSVPPTSTPDGSDAPGSDRPVTERRDACEAVLDHIGTVVRDLADLDR